jgi:serine/threonine protein kinase
MKYYIQTDDEVSSEIWITEDKKLGRGATATVYSILHDGKYFAAKIYHHDRPFDSEKIRAMLENPPDCAEVIHNGQDYPQIAWPLAIIENDQGDEVGFLLPLVDIQESFTLDHYYDQGLFKKLNSLDESALSYKLEIARNLSKIVAELHSHEHYFIDCKPQNIRVFKRNHVVTLIDCDGFSINGNEKRFPAELLSTDYIAPEAQRELTSPTLLSEDQDRYALAVILFQLLNRGTHPFQGIITDPDITCSTNDEKAALGLYPYGTIRNFQIKPRPQSTHHLWDSETRRLFDQAFTAKEQGARPSAQQWADHFETLLLTKTLVRCDKFPNDLAHIRFKDMACPACYLNSLQTFTPPPPVKRREAPRSFSQPQPAPYTNTPSQTSSGNGFWWVVSVIAVIFLITIFNSDKKSTPAYTPPVVTTPAPATSPPVLETAPVINTPSGSQEQFNSNQYISLYASNSRAIGYSIGNSTESKAKSDGYQQCAKQITGTNDTCMLVLSGKGRCLAISRSTDGAIGASIGSSPMTTATQAQTACKSNGGKNCPHPTDTTFCSN